MRKRKKSDGVNTNEWMNTYADTVTLLLCFFVLLFASSTMNEQKWKEIVEAFRMDPSGGAVVSVDWSDVSEFSEIPVPEPLPNDVLYNTIQNYIENHHLSHKIGLIKGNRTVTLRFKDTILFNPDSTVLRADGKLILTDMCRILKDSIRLIEMIEIEGHTAASPKGAPEFRDTFEFSTQRATNVLKYSLEEAALDPLKLRAVGYGQYHPIGDNETAEGRAMNRRVEIIVTSLTAFESSRADSTETSAE